MGFFIAIDLEAINELFCNINHKNKLQYKLQYKLQNKGNG